jgi:hypothetical protein
MAAPVGRRGVMRYAGDVSGLYSSFIRAAEVVKCHALVHDKQAASESTFL